MVTQWNKKGNPTKFFQGDLLVFFKPYSMDVNDRY